MSRLTDWERIDRPSAHWLVNGTPMFDVAGLIVYGLSMIDAANDDDDDEEPLGPSLALPPLYLLRAANRCPECGEALHVYTLGCAAFHDAEDREPLEQFHFLRAIRSVPEQMLNLLKARCPSFYLDHADDGEPSYLMNHCRCGAKLDDDQVHGDVGVAFWPDTLSGFARLRLFRLPIAEAIPVECSYILGGGEYLSFDNAEA